MTKPPERGCRAPDWFYVANVPRLLDGFLRKSYVLWQESVAPPLVIEYVSGDGSEERDDTPYEGKFWVYEQAIKVPYYLIWHPNEERLEAFELRGTKYRRMKANDGRFHVPSLRVDFGMWDGVYLGYPGPWLRAWGADGRLLLTSEERADALAAKLRELGVDPDRI
jgi:Uma2 family endonuclease